MGLGSRLYRMIRQITSDRGSRIGGAGAGSSSTQSPAQLAYQARDRLRTKVCLRDVFPAPRARARARLFRPCLDRSPQSVRQQAPRTEQLLHRSHTSSALRCTCLFSKQSAGVARPPTLLSHGDNIASPGHRRLGTQRAPIARRRGRASPRRPPVTSCARYSVRRDKQRACRLCRLQQPRLRSHDGAPSHTALSAVSMLAASTASTGGTSCGTGMAAAQHSETDCADGAKDYAISH